MNTFPPGDTVSFHTMSIPHFMNGHGEMIGCRGSAGWCRMLLCLWQASHFCAYVRVSFFIVGQKYPVLRILEHKDLPPVWLPQSPSWMSFKTSLASLSSRHLRYGPAMDFIYNVPWIIVKRDVLILKVLSFSYSRGILPFSMYSLMGFVQDPGESIGSCILGLEVEGSLMVDTWFSGSWFIRSDWRLGSSIAGIMRCTIGIIVSGGILSADPRLARASASVFSSLGTWLDILDMQILC